MIRVRNNALEFMAQNRGHGETTKGSGPTLGDQTVQGLIQCQKI